MRVHVLQFVGVLRSYLGDLSVTKLLKDPQKARHRLPLLNRRVTLIDVGSTKAEQHLVHDNSCILGLAIRVSLMHGTMEDVADLHSILQPFQKQTTEALTLIADHASEDAPNSTYIMGVYIGFDLTTWNTVSALLTLSSISDSLSKISDQQKIIIAKVVQMNQLRYPWYRESEQRREQGDDLNRERPQEALKVREDFLELEKEIQIQGASPKLRIIKKS
ncbi:hypothetical protein VNO77_22493 [Canavalia gladiata]|uniref:Uncharacterized protein n=1 Tax=Canavalia gladiata TaxID=3824 RepID=A0AAN9L7X3_CANGL